MAEKRTKECDHCGKRVRAEHFQMTFAELAPPDIEQLSGNKPEDLLKRAEEIEQRAKELQTTLVYSDEANAYRLRAAQEVERGYDVDEEGEVAQVRNEIDGLVAEAIRGKDALKALKRQAKEAEPLVRFGSGVLDFCEAAHAIAFLRERYE